MQHHEPECLANQKKYLLSSRSRSQRRLVWSKYDCLLFLLTCGFFGNQTWSNETSSKARVPSETNKQTNKNNNQPGLLHSRSRSQPRVKMSMFVKVMCSKPPNILLPNCIVVHHHEPECHIKILVCLFQGQVHSKGSYNQIRQFLQYLLNCWSFCYQTWFDGTLSKARVSWRN